MADDDNPNELDDLKQESQAIEDDLDKDAKMDDSNDGNDGNSGDDGNDGNDGNDGSDGGDGNDSGGDSGNDGEEDVNEDDYDSGELGISSAYGTKGKKEKEGSSRSGSSGAPDRGKFTPSKKDGKGFMDVFYEEFVVAFIEWSMKKTVDLHLDFADYVLFKAYASDGYVPAEENNKKTVFEHGKDVENRYKERVEKANEMYGKAFGEVLANIERLETGENPEWRIWQGGEPRFFQDLVELKRKAEADPTSPEAETWKRILKSPERMEGMCRTELLTVVIATRLATLEEAASGDKFELPKPINKGLEKMDKIIENFKKPEDLKADMAKQIEELLKITNTGNPVDVALTQRLNAMKKLATGNETDKKKLVQGFNEIMKDMREYNPVSERIELKAAENYAKLKLNRDKIREAHAGDPEKIKEVTLDYLKTLVTTIDNIHKDVEKSYDTGKVMNVTQSAISGAANAVHLHIGTRRQKAQDGVNKVKEVFEGFKVDNVPLKDRPDVADGRRSTGLPMDRAAVMRSLASRFRGR